MKTEFVTGDLIARASEIRRESPASELGLKCPDTHVVFSFIKSLGMKGNRFTAEYNEFLFDRTKVLDAVLMRIGITAKAFYSAVFFVAERTQECLRNRQDVSGGFAQDYDICVSWSKHEDRIRLHTVVYDKIEMKTSACSGEWIIAGNDVAVCAEDLFVKECMQEHGLSGAVTKLLHGDFPLGDYCEIK